MGRSPNLTKTIIILFNNIDQEFSNRDGFLIPGIPPLTKPPNFADWMLTGLK
jgi:hypothetical protein